MNKSNSKPFLRWVRRQLLSPTRKQIEDYATAIRTLIWQRQGIFLAATLLAAIYVDVESALVCYSTVILTELFDLQLARRIDTWDGKNSAEARSIAWRIIVNTALSATAITVFVLMIAFMETQMGHFTPLFFLFAAALFCAMNNHQIVGALLVRLAIYGAGFVTIALIDVVRHQPPLSSPIWLQFFTVVFVMYFIIDVSRLYLGMYRDSLKQIANLEEEHRKSKAAYRIKSNFVSTVSHELRTPLTSIKGSLDLISNGSLGPVPDHLAPVLSLAGRNCERLSDLINDILDVQSLEAGRFVSELKPICVEDFVEEAVQNNFGYADKHGVYLDHTRPDRTTMMNGDRRRLIQVMTNLISNAVKFSDQGDAVCIRTEVVSGKVVVFVEDNGIGIPDDARDKVFGQFAQIDSSDQRDYGGTGLGMNITQQIVDLHRGVIDYVSEIGVGTTFMVAFDTMEQPNAHGELTGVTEQETTLPAVAAE